LRAAAKLIFSFSVAILKNSPEHAAHAANCKSHGFWWIFAACGVCGVLGGKSQNGYGEKRKPVSIYLILIGLI